jgi:hypothetical protein
LNIDPVLLREVDMLDDPEEGRHRVMIVGKAVLGGGVRSNTHLLALTATELGTVAPALNALVGGDVVDREMVMSLNDLFGPEVQPIWLAEVTREKEVLTEEASMRWACGGKRRKGAREEKVFSRSCCHRER